MSDKAIFYITDQQQYADLAAISARSFRRFHPADEVGIYLYYINNLLPDFGAFTDTIDLYNFHIDFQPDNPGWFFKQTCYMPHILMDLRNADEELSTAIYLDCDTYFCAGISELFDLFPIADMAGAIPPRRCMTDHDPHIPASFPEWNIGVNAMLLRGAVINFWKDVAEHYRKNMDYYGNDDQMPFRAMMWKYITDHSDLNFITIAPEWNLRFNFACQASGEVKILHAKSPDLEAIARKANEERGFRAWPKGIRLE